MGVPISQMWTVATYVLKQKIKRNKHYPLVLMLEPLFRCNLSCAGCGKIQYPGHILKKHLSVEECMQAVDECNAPIVSIPGGEPLLHPDMPKIIEELVKRKKYIYLCTNAILLEKKIDEYTPSKYLTFSIHLDGLKEEHDEAVCRDGIYEKALAGTKVAIAKGHRVTTNTTLFLGAKPERVRLFFDEISKLKTDGIMISPGYSYSKAPNQESFLQRKETYKLFRQIFHRGKKSWKFNHSPLFIEFLAGKQHFECTPWGNPTFSIFGWQKPCYLLQEGYTKTFAELIEQTKWEEYGQKSNNPECVNCMVHSGHEPTTVDYTFGSFRGFFSTVRATLFGPKIPDPETTEVPSMGGK